MTDLDTAPTAPAEPGPRRRPLGSTLARIAVIVSCLLLLAMWVYAFGFASKDAAYRVDDASWRERAEDVCARYEEERLSLVDTDEGYIDEPTDEQMLQRADIVDRATDILQAQLDEVTAVQPASDDDRQIVADYRGFWEMLIGDRRRYTDELRALDLQPYRETKIDGGPVSNVIVDFTIVNEMRSCTPPGELGGDT